jgi:hypothetical protein
MPQDATPLIPFHVEHIVSRQHGGSDDPSGLALACDRCNAYKGPNLTSIDPETRTVVALFNPRESVWSGHIIGLTPTGRATVRLLNMNAPRRAEFREEFQRAPIGDRKGLTLRAYFGSGRITPLVHWPSGPTAFQALYGRPTARESNTDSTSALL